MSRPNVLMLMMDELVGENSYDNEELKEWQRTHLKAQTYLKETGFNFKSNYTCSSGCVPSRTCLFTGSYATSISQTDLGGKTTSDPGLFWLDANTFPTMGNYLKQAGYNTIYNGKWHISNPDIILPGTTDPLVTYYDDGTPNLINTKIYKNANRLKDYGFDNYLGSQPTGNSPLNTGGSSSNKVNGRDVIYAEETINNLKELDKDNSDKPWLIVTSLVNPHDIAAYGEISKKLPTFNFDIDPSVPYIPPPPNANDDLSTKPDCQLNYKYQYQIAFQPTVADDDYRRVYQSLILKADRHLQRILKTLGETRFNDNCLVILCSDHGEASGSHGLFQKWYCAYEEAIHIPLIIKLPKSFHDRKEPCEIENLTSNIDILPTILGLCCVNVKEVTKQLKKTHYLTDRLVGRDLSKYMINSKEHIREIHEREVILFITSDNVLLGDNMIGVAGNPYKPLIEPNDIRTIVTRLDGILYKFSVYFEDPRFWTTPFTSNVWSTPSKDAEQVSSTTITIKVCKKAKGKYRCECDKCEPKCVKKEVINTITEVGTNTIVTTTIPANKVYEMYNLTDDPIEMINLMYNPSKETLKIASILREILREQIVTKILIPKKEYIYKNIENFKAP